MVENIEYRISNKEPQNDEGFTSTFDIPCSTFCGLKNIVLNQILTTPVSGVYCAHGIAGGLIIALIHATYQIVTVV